MLEIRRHSQLKQVSVQLVVGVRRTDASVSLTGFGQSRNMGIHIKQHPYYDCLACKSSSSLGQIQNESWVGDELTQVDLDKEPLTGCYRQDN